MRRPSSGLGTTYIPEDIEGLQQGRTHVRSVALPALTLVAVLMDQPKKYFQIHVRNPYRYQLPSSFLSFLKSHPSLTSLQLLKIDQTMLREIATLITQVTSLILVGIEAMMILYGKNWLDLTEVLTIDDTKQEISIPIFISGRRSATFHVGSIYAKVLYFHKISEEIAHIILLLLYPFLIRLYLL